jgi:hypothetical protein
VPVFALLENHICTVSAGQGVIDASRSRSSSNHSTADADDLDDTRERRAGGTRGEQLGEQLLSGSSEGLLTASVSRDSAAEPHFDPGTHPEGFVPAASLPAHADGGACVLS